MRYLFLLLSLLGLARSGDVRGRAVPNGTSVHRPLRPAATSTVDTVAISEDGTGYPRK
jgi:hypothetical protein